MINKINNKGFTLIELMVTLAVMLVLLLIAQPSFESFRQRSAMRGAAEQVLGFWNQARFEAAKRNTLVKVGVQEAGGSFCLGAATTSDPADASACNCLVDGSCDVAIFPAVGGQGEWRGVTYVSVPGVTPTLGGGNAVAVIEPKRASLATTSQAGVLTLAGPVGHKAYKLNLNIDKSGRGAICESNTAVDKMSDFTNRRCGP